MNLFGYVYQSKKNQTNPKLTKQVKIKNTSTKLQKVGYIRYKNALWFSTAVLSIA